MSVQEFDTEIFRGGDAVNSSSFFAVPFDVPAEYGTKAQVAVKGTIDGVEFRGTLMPYNGTHLLTFNKQLQDATGKRAGSTVHVTMERDTDARTLDIPGDVTAALDQNIAAKAAFERYSYSHKKEYLGWINEAKKPETRARRIEKTLEMVLEGKRLKT